MIIRIVRRIAAFAGVVLITAAGTTGAASRAVRHYRIGQTVVTVTRTTATTGPGPTEAITVAAVYLHPKLGPRTINTPTPTQGQHLVVVKRRIREVRGSLLSPDTAVPGSITLNGTNPAGYPYSQPADPLRELDVTPTATPATARLTIPGCMWSLVARPRTVNGHTAGPFTLMPGDSSEGCVIFDAYAAPSYQVTVPTYTTVRTPLYLTQLTSNHLTGYRFTVKPGPTAVWTVK